MNYKERRALLENKKIEADAGDAQAAYAVAALSNMDRDFETAFEYANLSVSLSNGKNHEALNILGDCYKHGFGCEKDAQKAFDSFSQSSELGNDEAQWKLGVMYIDGQVVDKDIDKAIYWLEKSTAAGNDMGQHYFGYAKMANEKGINMNMIPQENNNDLKPHMVLNLNNRQVTLKNDGEYFDMLDHFIKIANTEQDKAVSVEAAYLAKEIAVHGIGHYYEKRDIYNAELVYDSVKPFSMDDDSTDFSLILMEQTLENTYGFMKFAANEKDGLNHVVKAADFMRRLYEIKPNEGVKTHLIKQYRQTADWFLKFGDSENSEKYTILADKLTTLKGEGECGL